MGWASGSYMAEDLYDNIRKHIPKTKREKVAEAILSAFENGDADDWSQDSALWRDSGRPVPCFDCGEDDCEGDCLP